MRLMLILACVLLCFSFELSARGKGHYIRGGFGFLFPDHNRLNNPGQLTLDGGTGLELSYLTQEVGATSSQTARASISFAHKKKGFAFGIAGLRTGSSLDSTATSNDSAEAGLGVRLSKKVNIGVAYSRGISEGQTNDGELTAGLNLVPGKKGKGFSIGAAYTTTVNAVSNTAGATVGLGYSGKNRNDNIEVNASFPNLSDTSQYTGSLFLTLGNKSLYGGAGYSYIDSGATTSSLGQLRIGILLGKRKPWDFSLQATHGFDGGNPAYGATLRANL